MRIADNSDIAACFSELADRLEIKGDNPFRVRAYRNAARTVFGLSRELHDAFTENQALPSLPGIGRDLGEKIVRLLSGQPIPLLERLRQELPAGLMDLLKVQGLGPKRVHQLYESLKITDLAALEAAAREQRLRGLPRFGAKLEQQILDSLAVVANTARRRLAADVQSAADQLVERLRQADVVDRITVAGSLRRGQETIGDLDVLVTGQDPARITSCFVDDTPVATVLAQGPTRAAVQWEDGLQVDLRVVASDAYGAALHYFTGSKAHNIALRRRAQGMGLKINEYGVFRGETRIGPAPEEAAVFAAVDLPWIAPELREDRGEIEAALAGRLPNLVSVDDLRGDLHVHSRASDGYGDPADLADAAAQRGYEYIAITDHSHGLRVVSGLDERRLMEQAEAIDRFNAAGRSPVTILKGIEVEILENGDLDLPDRVLRELDLVIGSVHQHTRLNADRQTDRLLRAMDHSCFSILAHPTGRLLLERAPMALDMPRIIEHARQRGCALELNAQPQRLDLNDQHVRMARDAGVPVCINGDVHQAGDWDHRVAGIRQARRGWLEPANVLNTLPLSDLRRRLASMRRG